MDSLMFDPEGNQFRSVLKSEVNGQTKDDMVYEAEERTPLESPLQSLRQL